MTHPRSPREETPELGFELGCNGLQGWPLHPRLHWPPRSQQRTRTPVPVSQTQAEGEARAPACEGTCQAGDMALRGAWKIKALAPQAAGGGSPGACGPRWTGVSLRCCLVQPGGWRWDGRPETPGISGALSGQPAPAQPQ